MIRTSLPRLLIVAAIVLVTMAIFDAAIAWWLPQMNGALHSALVAAVSSLAAVAAAYHAFVAREKPGQSTASKDGKSTEKDLTGELFLLSQLVNNLPDFIYVKDMQARYIIKNKADAAWIGVDSPEQVVGKTDFDYYPPDLAAKFYADDMEVVTGGKTISVEEPSIDPTGKVRWILTTKTPVRDLQGEIIGLVGIGRDLTEQKRSLDEIKQLKEFNESIIQTMTEGIIVQDANAIITFVNPATCLITGYAQEELIHKTDEVFIAPEQHTIVDAADDRRKRGISDHYEIDLIRKDGQRVTVLVSGSPYFHDGRFSGTVAIFTDITERKKAERQLQLQLRRMAALHDIDMAINASMNLSVTLNLMLGQVTAQLQVDAADILLCNPGTQTLEYAAGYGFRTNIIKRTLLWLGEDLPGQAALERRQVHVPNLHENGHRSPRAQLLADENFQMYFGVPLIAKGQVKGVLEVFHRSSLDVNPDWIGFLEALATQAAIAIENSELFEGMQRSNIELKLAYDATIEGWSRALDLRDKETEGHTQRVTEMTILMASRLGFSETELTHIRRGALLHDIGKMGISDSILLKPGPLTEEEWEIMHQHPVYAYNLISPIAFLRPALDIPYCHHEKWDGSGYPRGLKGEEIPLSARIFAIVDVWDALRSVRPYRKEALSEEKVIEYIRAQSGKHFDPRVVDTFMHIIDRIIITSSH